MRSSTAGISPIIAEPQGNMPLPLILSTFSHSLDSPGSILKGAAHISSKPMGQEMRELEQW